MPRKLPPQLFETIARQLTIGLGKIASRALVSGGKSVARDIENAGKEVQRRAKHAQKRLDDLIGSSEEEDE